jgi:hypothetical protein
MKVLKLAMVSVVLALAMVATASADEIHAKPGKVVKVTVAQALKIQGLATEMYKQLDESMLNNNQQVYVGRVKHNHNLYLISGNYNQWKRFFSMKWKYYAVPNQFGIQSR